MSDPAAGRPWSDLGCGFFILTSNNGFSAIPHKLLFYIFITNVVSKLLALSPQRTPIGRGFSRMYAEKPKDFCF
ncbi:MAG: hypothetical protein NTW32_27565, partial [Chloroflexi bacterium]|nr:hypothetical protein [Chloroflexota bacterium]